MLRLQGLADPDFAAACQTALRLVAEEMVIAETDIPWGVRER
ncbi:MAG: hypothetical protein QOG10_4413, partial [Kribbellaceae bacterium]|nr:hypothetical protein [Kribbellaceae bacterium]